MNLSLVTRLRFLVAAIILGAALWLATPARGLLTAASPAAGKLDQQGSHKSAEASSVVTANAERGFLSRSFLDENGLEHKYLVFVPSSRGSPSARIPVILFLNGFNENGQDGVRQIRNNFGLQVWEMEPWFPFLAVIPQCSEGADWSLGGKDAEWTLAILDEVIREFGGDADRVCLTGVSAGGSGVWQIGSAYPERFAALVPLCGTATPNFRMLADAGMPVWNFHNDKDRPELVDANRKIRDGLISAGLSPLATEFDAIGHDCWNQAWRMHALYGWMLQQNRRNNRPTNNFVFTRPNDVATNWTVTGDGTWKADVEQELVGHASSGEVFLISPFTGRQWEFHADFWMPKAGVQLEVLQSGADHAPLKTFRIQIPLVSQGSGGVLATQSHQWLCELDPSAQHWLRTEWWNEVRVRMDHGRLQLLLNGWMAADVVLPASAAGSTYQVALVASGDGNTRVRYFRHRVINDSLRPLSESSK